MELSNLNLMFQFNWAEHNATDLNVISELPSV